MGKRPDDESEHLPPDDEDADFEHEETEAPPPVGPPAPEETPGT